VSACAAGTIQHMILLLGEKKGFKAATRKVVLTYYKQEGSSLTFFRLAKSTTIMLVNTVNSVCMCSRNWPTHDLAFRREKKVSKQLPEK
jgi:hypothetical protein